MKILIAEDEGVSLTVLEKTLQAWGHEVVVARDGDSAWSILQQEVAPKLAILDWVMPGLDGVEVCRLVRELKRPEACYVILLTALQHKDDVVAGLAGGADDFVSKPFHRGELQARIRVGERIIDLQRELAERVRALEAASASVKQLQGLLPICSYCKNVRDDQNYWQRVDAYLMKHSDVKISHGICPDCFSKIALPQIPVAEANPDANPSLS